MMHDMSTQQFLLGFRRFVARHGNPRRVISDKAAQFKLASDTIYNLWGEILTEDDVISYATNQNIHWDFNVELAPWILCHPNRKKRLIFRFVGIFEYIILLMLKYSLTCARTHTGGCQVCNCFWASELGQRSTECKMAKISV